MAKEKCGLTGCGELMGPGSAEVGYMTEADKLGKIRVCPKHAWLLMTSQPGSYRITPNLKLEPIPASPTIFHK